MSAYAVIKTGGKQYRVQEGDVLDIEKVAGDAGAALTLDEVLAINTGDSLAVGSDAASASVTAEVVEQFRDKKIVVFKKKRRKGYTKRQGHRQSMTKIKITGISA